MVSTCPSAKKGMAKLPHSPCPLPLLLQKGTKGLCFGRGLLFMGHLGRGGIVETPKAVPS